VGRLSVTEAYFAPPDGFTKNTVLETCLAFERSTRISSGA